MTKSLKAPPEGGGGGWPQGWGNGSGLATTTRFVCNWGPLDHATQIVVTTMDYVVSPATAVKRFDSPKLVLTA